MPRFQPPVEHIDLIPTPMDTWRAALDALIACAPGDTSDISWHLADAHQSSLLLVDRTVASPGAERLIDRLMLISAGRLFKHSLSRDEAFEVSSRLLASARQHAAAPLPDRGGAFATYRPAEHPPASPDRRQGRPDPARDQSTGDAREPQTPNASTHQEPGDRG